MFQTLSVLHQDTFLSDITKTEFKTNILNAKLNLTFLSLNGIYFNYSEQDRQIFITPPNVACGEQFQTTLAWLIDHWHF